MFKKITNSKYLPVIIIVILIGISAVVVFGAHRKNIASSTQEPLTALDKSIVALETTIKQNPEVIKSYIDLSNAYLQKIRETGDATYYKKIDALMNKAAAIDPENADIPATKASVAIGRHHFAEGKVFAQEAIVKNKNRQAYYGLLGDAAIELGQYDEAVDAFQKMVDIRPDFSSYSRIAYARELYGDIGGAKEALKLAISSGSSFNENIAWTYVELGKLELRTSTTGAETYFTNALLILPTHTQAYEGLGKVAFAKGDTQGAINFFMKALDGLPLAQYSTDLADVYQATGNTTKRDQYIAVTETAYKASASSGVGTDLEEALFLSDHDIDLSRALELAKRAYDARPGIYAADYLAWAQYKNNNISEAVKYRKEALRLGETDALILFHQGMIALKNNERVLAKKYLEKAYAINPNFSILYSKILKETIDTIK